MFLMQEWRRNEQRWKNRERFLKYSIQFMVSLFHICFKTCKSRTTEVDVSRMIVCQSFQCITLFSEKVDLSIVSSKSYTKNLLNEFL